MKLEDIENEWDKDCGLEMDLTIETQRTPRLHNKYMRMWTRELAQRSLRDQELRNAKQVLNEYYGGTLSDEELKELGRRPFGQTILKTDRPNYINNDEWIKELENKLLMSKVKVDTLEHIIRQIRERNFHIKNMIELRKFETGG